MRLALVVLLLAGRAPGAPDPVEDEDVAEAGPGRDADPWRSDDAISLQAERLLYLWERDLAIASDTVRLEARGLTLLADRVEWDRRAGTMEATGSVTAVLDRMVATGDAMRIDTEARTLSTDRGRVFLKRDVDPAVLAAGIGDPSALPRLGTNELVLGGRRIRRVGPRRLLAEDAWMSLCACLPESAWLTVQAAQATVDAGERAELYWPVLKLGPVPILVLPYLSLPLTSRASGLLVPEVEQSTTEGWVVRQPLFLTLGRSADLTLAPGWIFGPEEERAADARGPLLDVGFRYAYAPALWGSAQVGLLYDLQGRRAPSSQGLRFDGEPQGLRGSLAWRHEGRSAAGFFLRSQGALVSDGFYVSDRTTDVEERGREQMRGVAFAGHADEDRLIILEAGVVQDLRYGYGAFSPEGSRPLMALPAVRYLWPLAPLLGTAHDPSQEADPDPTIPGALDVALLVGVELSLTRHAPLLAAFDDVGVDGRFVPRSPDAGERDGVFEAGERQARDRIAVHPRLFAPFGAGRWLRGSAGLGAHLRGYVGEVDGATAAVTYGHGHLALETELSRGFGALTHRLRPRAELRVLTPPAGSAGEAFDPLDALDLLPPAQGAIQGRLSVQQSLGGAGPLSMEGGIGVDLALGSWLPPAPSTPDEGFVSLTGRFGPVRFGGDGRLSLATGAFRRMHLSTSTRLFGVRLSARYDGLFSTETGRMAAPGELLLGLPSVLPTCASSEDCTAQLLSAGVVVPLGAVLPLASGIDLAYSVRLDPEALDRPEATAAERLVGQSFGIALEPPCGCFSATFSLNFRNAFEEYAFRGGITWKR